MAAVGRIGRALRRVGTGGRATTKAAAEPVPTATAAKKAPGKKAPAKKAPVKKTVAPKAAPVRKAPAKKAPVKKVAAKKTVATKAAPVKKAPAKKVAAKKVAAKKAVAAKKTVAAAVTLPKGSQWTKAELATVRRQLESELADMRTAYSASMRDLDDLQRSRSDGAGDDQADAGSKTFDREQEQSIAANRMDLMIQFEHAVERIEAGTYGFCERCGKPIPKARLMAFPAATLDVGCKQREERR